MNKTYHCTYDPSDIYTDKIVNANTLIEDYIDTCNEVEDADTIGWLYTTIEDNEQEKAIEFIANGWGLELTEI